MGREGTIFYSTLPLPPAHEHSDIYLQLCMWDGYQVFLIATLVFTRLLLSEIYHFIGFPFDWLIDWWSNVFLFTWLFHSVFLLQQFDTANWTGRFELASIITLVLQAKQVTMCASHPKRPIRPEYNLWNLKKKDSSSPRNFLKNTNEHTCDYFRYVTLLICLCWSVVWFWEVISLIIFYCT